MPMPATVLQMNSESFKRRVAKAAGLTEGDESSGERISDNFSVRPETAELALLTVNAPSEHGVIELSQAIVRTLNANQQKLRVPVLDELNSQMSLIDANIASIMKVRATLASSDSIGPPTSSDPAAIALRRTWVLDLISRNEERLAAANNERRALAARLGISKTYPATLNDDLVIRQTSPRPGRNAAYAGAVALLVLVLYAMMSKPRSSTR